MQAWVSGARQFHPARRGLGLIPAPRGAPPAAGGHCDAPEASEMVLGHVVSADGSHRFAGRSGGMRQHGERGLWSGNGWRSSSATRGRSWRTGMDAPRAIARLYSLHRWACPWSLVARCPGEAVAGSPPASPTSGARAPLPSPPSRPRSCPSYVWGTRSREWLRERRAHVGSRSTWGGRLGARAHRGHIAMRLHTAMSSLPQSLP